jgi:hypothetical protein
LVGGVGVRPSRIFRGGHEGLGLVTAHALDDVHAAIYGHPPQATHAWTENEAILVVFRTHCAVAAVSDDGDMETEAETVAIAPLASLQRMVIATVWRRTGETLLPLGQSANAPRGLAVLAFEHARKRGPMLTLSGRVREPVLGRG